MQIKRRESFHLDVPLLAHRRKVESDEQARDKQTVTKKNTSLFHSHLYNFFFQGEVVLDQRPVEMIRLPSGEFLKFMPDIIRREDLLGEQAIETKSVSHRLAQPTCKLDQVEGYAYRILHRMESGDASPNINYLFVRYGVRENLHLQKNGVDVAVRKLAATTRDMVVVPFNLALFLFMNSRVATLNQTSSVGGSPESKYYFVGGQVVNLLHEFAQQPGDFIRAYQAKLPEIWDASRRASKRMGVTYETFKSQFERTACFARKYLAISDLSATQRPSDNQGDLFINEHYVSPFPITTYQLRNHPAWLKTFKKHSGKILKERLNLRDFSEPPF